MGCDIHIYPEKLTKGRWIYRPIFGNEEPRIYRLFGILAGVRDPEESPIASPRGLPGNISETTRAEADEWGPDMHTPSWLTLSELETRDWKFLRLWESIKYLIWGMEELSESEDHKDVRIVFWFDN